MVDDLILINTFVESAKVKHITNDKTIALSMVEQYNPFNMVSIKGKILDPIVVLALVTVAYLLLRIFMDH